MSVSERSDGSRLAAEVTEALTGLAPHGHEPPRTLRQLCEHLGVPAAEVDRAARDGSLALLAVDHLVRSQAGSYTQREVTERSGLGEDATRFWRALGFPDPDPDDRAFDDTDLEMLRLVESMMRLELLEPEVALQMARVIGSSIARIAQAQIESIEARAGADAVGQERAEALAVQRVGMILPVMPRMLDYTWRRHLQNAARRRLVRLAGEGGPDGATPSTATVGFADLVGFTALAQQLADEDLAHVVDRFESLAYDIVGSLGGRVVKMIGDEVMFAVATPRAGVEIALTLADAYRDDDALSDVRVGLAHGEVLRREGDLYGRTVNLASRIVSIAYPGSVVVGAEVRGTVGDDPRFAWKALRTRQLKDIGRVQLWAVRWAEDPFERERAVDRARRRQGTVRDRVADLLDEAAGAGEERVQHVLAREEDERRRAGRPQDR